MNSDFEKIYSEYYLSVLRFSRTLTFNLHDAEDLTAQTFLELYNKFSTLEFTEKTPKSWLFRTARFKYYNLAKKNSKLEVSDEIITFTPDMDESFVKKIEDKDIIRQVMLILEKMPSQTREIVMMRAFEEMSYAEIGKIIGANEAAVKIRYYRAIQKIKAELEKKKKKILALPMVFGAIREYYESTNEGLKVKPFAFPKPNLGTTQLITIGSIALIFLIGLGAFLIVKNNPTKDNDNNQIANNTTEETTPTPTILITQTEVPTSTPTPSSSITQTPVPTATVKQTVAPTPTSTPTTPPIKSYSNTTYGFALTMPTAFTYSVITNPECQGMGEPSTPGLLSCDQLRITNPASGTQLIVSMGPNNGVAMDYEGACMGGASIGSVTILGAARTKNPTTSYLCYNNANSIVKGANRITAYLYQPSGAIPSDTIAQMDGIVSSIR